MKLEDIPLQVVQQYSHLYGPYHPGDYPVGSEIPGLGEVLWSYQAKEGLTYVCTGDGFPCEILASEVVG